MLARRQPQIQRGPPRSRTVDADLRTRRRTVDVNRNVTWRTLPDRRLRLADERLGQMADHRLLAAIRQQQRSRHRTPAAGLSGSVRSDGSMRGGEWNGQCRSGADPGVVGRDRRADAVESLGQSTTQLRYPPHRAHSNPDARLPRPRLLPTAHHQGKDQSSRTTLRQTPHRSRLSTVPCSPTTTPVTKPRNQPRLDIGAIARDENVPARTLR